MTRTKDTRRGAGVAIAVLAVSLLLAACGGSSSPKTTSTASSGTSASAANTTAGRGAGRFAAVRSCLQKAGITLPARPAGARPPGAPRGTGAGGFLFGGGAGAGAGAAGAGARLNTPKMRAALAKCGLNFGAGGPGAGAGGFRNFRTSATYKTAITKFVACMKTNGVNLPAPNLSGTGAVFKRGAVSTTSPAFTKAAAKCQSLIPRAPRPAGAPGAAGDAGAAPQTSAQ